MTLSSLKRERKKRGRDEMSLKDQRRTIEHNDISAMRDPQEEERGGRKTEYSGNS